MLINSPYSMETLNCKTCPDSWSCDTTAVNFNGCGYKVAYKYVECYCPSDTCKRNNDNLNQRLSKIESKGGRK
jgi:hypothetical protein